VVVVASTRFPFPSEVFLLPPLPEVPWVPPLPPPLYVTPRSQARKPRRRRRLQLPTRPPVASPPPSPPLSPPPGSTRCVAWLNCLLVLLHVLWSSSGLLCPGWLLLLPPLPPPSVPPGRAPQRSPTFFFFVLPPPPAPLVAGDKRQRRFSTSTPQLHLTQPFRGALRGLINHRFALFRITDQRFRGGPFVPSAPACVKLTTGPWKLTFPPSEG